MKPPQASLILFAWCTAVVVGQVASSVFAAPARSLDPFILVTESDRPTDHLWVMDGGRLIRGPAGPCVSLPPGVTVEKTFSLASAKDDPAAGQTWLWFAVRLWGTTAEGRATVRLTVQDETGEILGTDRLEITKLAPSLSWASYEGQAPAANAGRTGALATDGNLGTAWVSTPRTIKDAYLDLVFDGPRRVAGIRYLPRPGGLQGQIYRHQVASLDDAGVETLLAEGEWQQGAGWWETRFPETAVRRLRLRALSVQPYPTPGENVPVAGLEVEPVFVPDVSTLGKDFGLAPYEVFVAVPAERLGRLRGKPLRLELSTAGSAAILLDSACAAEFSVDPPPRERSPRHSEFIDLNALGMAGLTCEHWSGLQVHEVAPGSAADKAGLEPRHVILAIDGRRLPPPRLEATSYPRDAEWLDRHHEPFVSRLYWAAVTSGRSSMQFRLWDSVSGEECVRDLPVATAPPEAWDGFPLSGTMSDALYEELITAILREQKPDGSWGTFPASMGEAFGVMALLGTSDVRHQQAIHRGAAALMRKDPPGGGSRYLGLWDIAFRAMGIGEYALATHDPRAVAWLEATCNALTQGANVNNRNYLAFGHDRRVLAYGNGGLVAPLSHIVIGDSLARRLGVTSDVAEVFDPYLRAGWASAQPRGRQCQGYGSPSSGAGADQAWCRSGLVALNYHLRGDMPDLVEGLTEFMRLHHGFMRRSHGYGNPGGHLGLMALAGANPSAFREVMTHWAPVFAMQWVPGQGLGHVESQITNTFARDPVSSGRLFSHSLAVVLSSRHRGLHVTGRESQGWLPTAADAVPPRPMLVRSTEGVTELRPTLLRFVTARFTTDGSAPSRQSPPWTPGPMPADGPLIVAYEGPNGVIGPAARLESVGEMETGWEVVAADIAFPDEIVGIPDVREMAIKRAQCAFDGNPNTWLRTNNGIHPADAAAPLTWSVTVVRRSGSEPDRRVAGFVFPEAAQERPGVDDSASSVSIEAGVAPDDLRPLIAAQIGDDRRVMLPAPTSSACLKFTFQSHSGTLLLLPDVEFIR